MKPFLEKCYKPTRFKKSNQLIFWHNRRNPDGFSVQIQIETTSHIFASCLKDFAGRWEFP